MECAFQWDKNIILKRDVFRISCHDSKRAHYIMMRLSAVDIIKEYISRTRCRNGLLENTQATILVGVRKYTIQCGIQKDH